MNRLRYIFLSLFAVLGLSGCVGELVSNVSKDIQRGEKILVDFSIVLPDDVVKTKALEETPTISTLHLAVFDDAGYLVEYAEANKVPVNVNEKTEAYTVTLTLSNAKRIIHFIANSVEIPKYGTEAESIGGMVSADKWDIYWQRKVLDKGITKGPDGKLSDQTRNDLSNIGLVRNFAKLTMSSIADGFEPLSFYMAKERRRGTVAPYNTATGRFIDNYQTYSSLADLQGIGYDGFIPEDTPVDEYIPATTAEFDAVATPFGAASDKYTNFHYLYERETPVSFDEQPFIIVKGNRGGKGPFYYKISLNNADGKSFPILRNFNYGITIKTVSRDGNDTPLKAANSSGSGDISTSMDPTLINISDGTARLFVSYTDTLLVSGGNIKFRYRYLPDVSAGTSANGILANPETATNAGVYFDVVDKNGNVITSSSLIGNVISNVQVDDADKTDGYREVTLTIKDPSATTEWQYLRIYGQKEGDGSIRDVLYRTISFQLMQKQPLIVRCVPKEIELEQGTPITIQTGIPAGFGKAQFPMDIAIEAVNLTLTPNGDNLPVQTGKSLTNSGKPAFWFIRTITYDEYAAMATETVTVNGQRTNYKFFDSHFKSNTAASASQVVATNRYFLDGSDTFTNYTPNVFTPVNMTGSFQAGQDGGKVTLTFNLPTLPSQGDVTILLDGADLDPAVDQPIEQVGTQVVDGKTYGKYVYKPNNTGAQAIKLISTDQNTGVITARLSAYHYKDAAISATQDVQFYFGDSSHTLGDIWYSGANTQGMRINTTTTFTWYVHFDALDNVTLTGLDWSALSRIMNEYTSSITINGQTLKGNVRYEEREINLIIWRPKVYDVNTITDENGKLFIMFQTDGTFTGSTIGNYPASFVASHNEVSGSEGKVVVVRAAFTDIRFPNQWYTSPFGNTAYTGTSTTLYFDVYSEDPSSAGQLSVFVNGGRQGDAQKTGTTVTYGGKTYTRYTWNYTPYFTGYLSIEPTLYESGIAINSASNTLPVGHLTNSITEGPALAAANFDTTQNYVLKSCAQGQYLRYNGSTLQGYSQLDESSFVKFGSNKSSSTIQNVTSGKYIHYNNASIDLNNTSTSMTISYVDRRGFTISYKSGRNTYYYLTLGGNGANMSASTSTGTNTYWDIIPVTVVTTYYGPDGNRLN